MSTKAEWDKLDEKGVGGLVGMILQKSAEERDDIWESLYDHAQDQIAYLEKENNILNNRLRNAENKFQSFFWDDSDEDWGP